MLDKTLAIVLATGPGDRLKPLTDDRTKSAVPFGGKYRIIDFSLTNCLHSGLRRILVLTQYKSHSLQKHLRDGWSVFNPELGEYITPVPPQMRAAEVWNTGTANALYQNRYLLERSGAQWALILPGDQIYRMDYAPLIRFHQKHGGTATVACSEVSVDQAHRFQTLCVDENHQVTDMIDATDAAGHSALAGHTLLASMGIYVFSIPTLLDWLQRDHAHPDSDHDFDREVIPELISLCPVYAYEFGGTEGRVSVDKYWRDVSTVDGFYEANLSLLEPTPPIDLYQGDWPIRTYPGQHPPARTVPGASGTEGICINSIVASGVVIAGGSAQHSILFPRVYLDDESLVEESILFDGVRVGEGARLRNCIIDKDVNVPAKEQIGYDHAKDRARFPVSEKGVVVVPKGYRFEAV